MPYVQTHVYKVMLTGFETKHVKSLHIFKNYVAIAFVYLMSVETCHFIFISVALVESDP